MFIATQMLTHRTDRHGMVSPVPDHMHLMSSYIADRWYNVGEQSIVFARNRTFISNIIR